MPHSPSARRHIICSTTLISISLSMTSRTPNLVRVSPPWDLPPVSLVRSWELEVRHDFWRSKDSSASKDESGRRCLGEVSGTPTGSVDAHEHHKHSVELLGVQIDLNLNRSSAEP